MEIYQLGEFTIELVKNPSKTLSLAKRQTITHQSIPVARRAFRNEGVTETDIIIHAIEVDTAVYVRNLGGNLIGFSGFVTEEVGERTIIYLKGAALLPSYQGRGLFGFLSTIGNFFEAEEHEDPDSLLIGARTQSPIVFYFMTERLGLYPRVNAPMPYSLKPIFEPYAELVRAKHSDFQSKNGLIYDRDSMVIRRAYGGEDANGQEFGFCMYGDDIPWLDDKEEINKFVRDNLDLSNGDAFLLLGPFFRRKNLEALYRSVQKLNPCPHPIVKRFDNEV